MSLIYPEGIFHRISSLNMQPAIIFYFLLEINKTESYSTGGKLQFRPAV